MAKEKKDYTDEELRNMSDEELHDLGVKKEDVETDDEREEREAMGEPGSSQRRSMYARFKEANESAKALRDEVDRMRQEREEERRMLLDRVSGSKKDEKDDDPEPARPKEVDVRALKRDYAAKMKDGDFDKAAEIQDRIDTYQDELDGWREKREAWKDRQHESRLKKAAEEAGAAALSRAEQTRQKEAAEEAAEEIFERFPFLDTRDSEVCDTDAVAAVRARTAELVNGGMSFVRAMKKAAAEKGPRFAKINGYDDEGNKVDGKDQGNDRRGVGKDSDKTETRVERATRLAAEAAGRQPPNISKQGKGGRDGKTRLDIRKMTDAQLAGLSDEELAEIDGSNRVDSD